jgi:uncharacterized protein YjbJ (UPF0337 family)
MLDDPKVEGQGSEGEGSEEENLKQDLENDGEEGEDGKPLKWNDPKRIRKLYDESKEGRKALRALKELGLKPQELPRLREEMGRLQQYDKAYEQYLEEKKRGETTDEEDDDAREVQKRIGALKRQLKSLGVKMVDDEEDEVKSHAKSLESRKQEVIGRAKDRMQELLEDAGVDFNALAQEDARDLFEEIEFKIGQRLARDEAGKQAFVRGSLRPIEKYFKEVIVKVNLPVKKGTKGASISQLPPRMSGSNAGSSMVRSNKNGPPKNVRDATDDVLADLKARNAARRAEE